MVPSDPPQGRLSRKPSAQLIGNHEAIADLQYLYFRYRFGSRDPSGFVQWAIERLELHEEGDDLDIVLLAALTKADPAHELVECIFRKYGGLPINDEQLLAGKYVALLYERYLAGSETLKSLNSRLWWDIQLALDYPHWLSALSHTCELAAEINPSYQEPFKQEFQYIANLWSLADSYEEFEELYDPKVSRQHNQRR